MKNKKYKVLYSAILGISTVVTLGLATPVYSAATVVNEITYDNGQLIIEKSGSAKATLNTYSLAGKTRYIIDIEGAQVGQSIPRDSALLKSLTRDGAEVTNISVNQFSGVNPIVRILVDVSGKHTAPRFVDGGGEYVLQLKTPTVSKPVAQNTQTGSTWSSYEQKKYGTPQQSSSSSLSSPHGSSNRLELQDAKKALSNAMATIEQKDRLIDDLNNQVQYLESTRSNDSQLALENQKLRSEISRQEEIQRQLKAAKESVIASVNRIESQKKEIDRLENQLQQIRGEMGHASGQQLDHLNDKLSEKESELTQLRAQSASLEKERLQYDVKLQQKDIVISNLYKQIQNLKGGEVDSSQLTALQQQNTSLQQQIASLQAELNTAKSSQSQDYDLLKARNLELERQLANSNDSSVEYEALQRKYRDLEDQFLAYRNKSDQAFKHLGQNSSEQVEKLTLENDSLRKQIQQLNLQTRQYDRLATDNKTLQSEIVALRDKARRYDRLLADKKDLERQLIASQGNASQYNKLQEEYLNLERQLAASQSDAQKYIALQQQYQDLERQLTATQSRNGNYTNLQEQYDALKASSEKGLRKLAEENHQYQLKVKSLDEQANRLAGELEETQELLHLAKANDKSGELQRKETMNKQLLAQIQQLQNNLKERSEALVTLTAEHESLVTQKSVNPELENQNKVLKEQIATLETQQLENAKKMELLARDREATFQKLSEIDLLQSENQKLASELETLHQKNQQLASTNGELETLQNQTQKLSSEVEALRTENQQLASASNELEALREKNQELASANAELETLQSKTQQLTSELEALRTENQQLASTSTESEKLAIELQTALSENQNLNTKVTSLEKELAMTAQKVSPLKEHEEKLQTMLAVETDRNQELESHLEALTQQLDTAQNALSIVTTQNKELELQINDRTNTDKLTQDKMQELIDAANDLQSERDNLLAEANDLKIQLTDVQQSTNNFQQERQNLLARVESSEQTIQSLENKNQELSRQLETFQNQLATNSTVPPEEINLLKSQLEDSKKNYLQLREEYEILQTEMAAKTDSSQETNPNSRSNDKEIKKLEKELASLKKDYNKALEEAESYQEQLEHVTSSQASTGTAESKKADKYFREAEQKTAQNKYQEALEKYAAAYQENPYEKQYAHALANAYIKVRKPQLASKLLEGHLKTNPTDLDGYNQLGKAYLLSGNYEKAQKAFSAAIPVNVLSNYATTLKKLGELQVSKEIYELALNLNPQDSDLLFNQGNLYNESKDYVNAVKSYNQALAVRPNFPAAHYNLGLVYSKLGDNERAVKHLEEFVKLSPNTQNAKLVKDFIEKLKGS